ncbi:hypothetical protein ACYULU_15725, partial [Breznakiellaceae bacterium SP9]
VAMAGTTLLTISRDDVERARLLSQYKSVVDVQSKMVDAKREGKREGMIEGRREGKIEGKLEGKIEGKLETAKNALQEGVSIEVIRKITGLSLDEIKGL